MNMLEIKSILITCNWEKQHIYITGNILPEVSNPSTRVVRTHPFSAPQLHKLSSKSQSGLARNWNKKIHYCFSRRGSIVSNVSLFSICEFIGNWWVFMISGKVANKRSLFNLMWFAKTEIEEEFICGLRFDNLPCFIICSQTPSITVTSSTAISPLLPLPTAPSITN